MSISREGTCHYEFEIRGDLLNGGGLTGRLAEPVSGGAKRLVGHAPMLTAVEYQREAWQLYARVTLTATDRAQALVGQASFSVDRRFVRMLRDGDMFYMSRTSCGGVGLSVLRQDELIGAAGAITHVPLGRGQSVKIPLDLIEQAESAFRTRDPRYRMREHPIEISLAGETRITDGGRPTIGPYDVFIRHGFLSGSPGTDVCLSIERKGACSDTAAHTSAQLLDEEGIDLRDRQDHRW